jgi:aminoglycoside phosphotransferase (APT) family kinase protein
VELDETARRRLCDWLAHRLPGVRAVASLSAPQQLSGGYSAETLIFEAELETDGGRRRERFVLRAETPEPSVYPQQAPGLDVEVDIQFRTMAALAEHGRVPLARLVGYEPRAGVLSAPFFVMEFVEGVVPSVSPSYAAGGFFAEARPDERRRMVEDGLRVLAELHALDWRKAGFDWLTPAGERPGTARQLALWEAFAERELRGREHPVLAEGLAWLRRHRPEDGELVLSWGDSRLGNMIWRDFRCVCVTDFENVAIGPRALDLGWWLMFDRWSHESAGIARLPGEPTRDEQRAHYERCAGVRVGDTTYHEVLAAARYCAIVVRVMNRWVARGQLPADQRIWLENPATTCLADLLATRPAS